MEGFFFQLIAFGIVFMMFRTSFGNRYLWFMAGLLFIPDHFPLYNLLSTTSSRFFTFSLLVIFIFKNNVSLIQKIKYFPFKYSWSLVLIGFIITCIFDERLNLSVPKIINRGFGFFLDNFFMFLLCFYLIRTMDELLEVYRKMLLLFAVLAIYGIYNIITKDNFYLTLISKTYGVRDIGQVYMSARDGRFRISSFTWHPIYYGFVLSMGVLMSLLPLIIKRDKFSTKRVYLWILLGIIVNILFVNSRTPLFALVGGLIIFILFGLNINEKLRIVFNGLIILGIISTTVPKFSSFVSDSFDTFSSKGSKLEGSSVEMRNRQLNASLFVFYQNPVFGNGIYYITENMGFSSQIEKITSDSDFAGFESYMYKMLIEQGIIGIVTQTIFIIAILIYLLRNIIGCRNKFRKQFAILNIAMLCCFLLFIFGTGDLGTFKIFFAILGINIKGIETLKQQELVLLSKN